MSCYYKMSCNTYMVSQYIGSSNGCQPTLLHSMHVHVKIFTKNIICNVYTRSEGPLAEADAWGDDENEYYNDRPDARPPSPPASKAPLAEYSTPPSNLPVSYMSHFISLHHIRISLITCKEMSSYINNCWVVYISMLGWTFNMHICNGMDACIAAIRICAVLCRSVMGFTPHWRTRCPCTTLQRNSLSLICQTKMPTCMITRVGLIFEHLLLSRSYCLRFQLLYKSASTCDMNRRYWIMLKECFVLLVHISS